MAPRFGVSRCAILLVALAALSIATPAGAQPTTDNSINISAGPAGGIKVDPQGVLELLAMPDDATKLMRDRARAMRVKPGAGELVKASPMRMVSLTRLEKAVAARLAAGGQADEEMLNLAGLVRVQYVFLFPESKDIVIAGPAEGVMRDPTGRAIGTESGRAVLQLEDLVAALRAFAPGEKGAAVIGCSIDPTKSGLANLQKALADLSRQLRTKPTAEQANAHAATLRDALGLQDVTVNGVSPRTHFAKVLVEADYKMKLIAIGVDRKPAPGMKNYVEVANPAAVNRNAMKRWYFVPNYECVRIAADDTAMELVGDGVKLVGEDEVVAADGSRTQTGTADRASQAFTESFTKLYPQIARRAAVYGELRNVIDLSIAAAFMQKMKYFEKAGWTMSVFGNEKEFPIETHNAPKQVPTACIALFKGSRLAFPIGGGVSIQPRQALASGNLLSDDEGNVARLRDGVNVKDLPAEKWWWDGAE